MGRFFGGLGEVLKLCWFAVVFFVCFWGMHGLQNEELSI